MGDIRVNEWIKTTVMTKKINKKNKINRGDTAERTADRRWLLKMVPRLFPGKIGSAAPGEGPTHFFLNRALLRLHPALCESVMHNTLNKWILIKFRSITFCLICIENEGDVAADPWTVAMCWHVWAVQKLLQGCLRAFLQSTFHLTAAAKSTVGLWAIMF